MAALQLYNHTANKLMKGEVPVTNTYKCMLLSDAAVFAAEHETIAEVSDSRSYEVFGNGWAEGGEELANVDISIYNTNGSLFDADDIEVLISSGDLGPYKAFVVYDSIESLVLGYCQFTAAVTTPDMTAVVIEWPATGLINASVV